MYQEVAPTDDPDLAGFTYVKKKKTKSRATQNRSGKNSKNVSSPSSRSITTSTVQGIQDNFNKRKEILIKSQFYKDFQALLLETLELSSFKRPDCLKMLGIGTLSHNPSLTQLAFGLELADMISLDLSCVETADPMYTSQDREFLGLLGIKVRSVEQCNNHDTSSRIMIFAPHVPKSVYESTLRQFWTSEGIKNLCLLGNNLRHYPDIYSDTRLKKESPAILAVSDNLFSNVNLPTNFEFNNVFNDLSIQWFASAQSLPEISFEGCTIEQEKFEINQDDIEDESQIRQLEKATESMAIVDRN